MGRIDVGLAREAETLRARGAALIDAVLEPTDAAPRCQNCGCMVGTGGRAIKRGAVVVLQDPLRVLWRRRYVPLSPTEVVMFATIAKRGRATFKQIDEVMLGIGAKPENRSVLIYRIRQKFMALGAANPLERKAYGLTLVVEPDEANSNEVVIGIPLAEYDAIY